MVATTVRVSKIKRWMTVLIPPAVRGGVGGLVRVVLGLLIEHFTSW